ncbi:MAG: hypothetical protein ACKOBC_00005 [Hyphomicrobiales bacterium]
MIVNIFDMRADHMAVDPIDAVIVGYDSRVDRNGVTVVDVVWEEPVIRKDVSFTDALAWATALPDQYTLMIYDAASRSSYLAELRMNIQGAAERVILRTAIRRPPAGISLYTINDTEPQAAVEQRASA